MLPKLYRPRATCRLRALGGVLREGFRPNTQKAGTGTQKAGTGTQKAGTGLTRSTQHAARFWEHYPPVPTGHRRAQVFFWNCLSIPHPRLLKNNGQIDAR